MGGVIPLGDFLLPISSLQGIISALSMLLCILMVFINYEYGGKIAFFFISWSMLFSILQIFKTHALHSLPGTISSGVSLFSIIIIWFFFSRRRRR